MKLPGFPWKPRSADLKPNQHYYDEFAGWYERARHQGYHALLDRLEGRLVLPHAAGARVLDAGCGTGLILRQLHPLASQAVGVDLSAGMLRQAQERGLSVVQASLTELPFAAESFAFRSALAASISSTVRLTATPPSAQSLSSS